MKQDIIQISLSSFENYKIIFLSKLFLVIEAFDVFTVFCKHLVKEI
jgi:hypothetical protein